MPKRAASRAQIRCRRGKRARLVHDPSRPACEAQIRSGPACEAQVRSRGIKRKSHVLRACSSTAQTNNSWGSKRVRTALSSTTTPGFSARPKWWWRSVHLVFLFSSPKALCGLNSWGRRDWSNIGGDGPACLIAELVLANDVADYIRFRAVCPPWRWSSLDPRLGGGLDGRFLPRRWIMLDKAIATSPCCYRLLNVYTGECIQTDLPELAEHKLLALTPEGLLLLLYEPTLLARLLNPLTRQLTDLPPVTALLTPEQQRVWRSGVGLGDTIWVCGAGLADASTVAVCFRRPKVTAIAKPGDECWTVVDNRYIDSTLPFAGRFYCTVGRSVMVLDNSASDQRLVPAVQQSRLLKFDRMSGSLHLVDNGGELMLVHRMLRPSNDMKGAKYKMEYEVYRVDLDARELVLVKGLGGRAVFMGRHRAISIPADAFPSISADTLYFGFDCDEKTTMNQIDGYNVKDGSSEPCHYVSRFDMVHPYSLVDCLSHCIQGIGGHVA